VQTTFADSAASLQLHSAVLIDLPSIDGQACGTTSLALQDEAAISVAVSADRLPHFAARVASVLNLKQAMTKLLSQPAALLESMNLKPVPGREQEPALPSHILPDPTAVPETSVHWLQSPAAPPMRILYVASRAECVGNPVKSEAISPASKSWSENSTSLLFSSTHNSFSDLPWNAA
jgi:hypothetical protein